MTRSELLSEAMQQLDKAGWEHPRSLAEFLLTYALDTRRYHLFLHPNLPVHWRAESRFREMLARASQGEPLEYVTGKCEFYGIELQINPGVLIPRPESELIIDHARRIAPDGVLRAMDIGCGSGALTLAMFEQKIAHEVVAVDISQDAIRLTAANAMRLGFFPDKSAMTASRDLPGKDAVPMRRLSLDSGSNREHRDLLWLMHADVFSVTFRPPVHPFPLIVSNPPYVSAGEWKNLPVHIRDHEPREALFGGEDGLDVHRRLTRRLPGWLSPAGAFIGEIGSGQGRAALELHRSWAKRAELHPDYAGFDRFIIAYR